MHGQIAGQSQGVVRGDTIQFDGSFKDGIAKFRDIEGDK
jgi:hypothetical protein